MLGALGSGVEEVEGGLLRSRIRSVMKATRWAVTVEGHWGEGELGRRIVVLRTLC